MSDESNKADGSGPLAGLKVIDAAVLFAGPVIGTLLGDFGADVIKVEHPKGDALRTLGWQKDGVSLWWAFVSRNKRLVSIDFPARRPIKDSIRGTAFDFLPAGCDPGWVVPDALRDRYDLHLGDSRELLPRVLEPVDELDLFLHDSLHTSAHMTFEYETAWPVLRRGGILLSDDVFAWGAGSAFFDFARRVGRDVRTHGNYGGLAK